VRVWGLLLALTFLGCEQQQAGPLPLEVLPGFGLTNLATPITLRGERFNTTIVANYDNEGESFVDARFEAWLGEHRLEEVRWIGPTEMRATVPAGLPEGAYDLVVKDPRGRIGRLQRAFEVWEENNVPQDMGVDLSGPADAGADLPFPDAILADLGVLADIGVCPKICTNNCSGGYCQMDCEKGCICPTGIPCRTICNDTGCTGTIDCSLATRCDVTCTSASGGCDGTIACPSKGDCTVRGLGSSAYQGDIQCGTGRCQVVCLNVGEAGCTGSVYCTSACACLVTGFEGPVSCPSACSDGCGVFDGCDNC